MAEPAPTLAVAVVLYQPALPVLENTLRTLARAMVQAVQDGLRAGGVVRLVDNSPQPLASATRAQLADCLAGSGLALEYLAGQGNIGFGRANNLAFEGATQAFLLVLNPDVELDRGALAEALRAMQAEASIGLLAPGVAGADGRIGTLCKRYPSVLDLALRGFAPRGVQRLFAARLARYAMADLDPGRTASNPPIVSGCFMLFRAEFFRELGGFDPDFFLYFEDFDLSWRASRAGRSAYCPAVVIRHAGGDAARKGWRHIAFFARSALRFFNKHGWKFL